MGKRIISQRRGKGTSTYRAHSFRYIGKVKYNEILVTGGIIKDIVHSPGFSVPIAIVESKNTCSLMLAPEHSYVGENISELIKPLKDISIGTKIYNIERRPGDGGKICRSAGSFGVLISKERGYCTILLPSKKTIVVKDNALATIGIPAGSGREEKPLTKAGKAYYKYKAKGKHYPRTSGVSMNAVDHPFGGSTKTGKPKTISRHMPPGKKVGSVSAKRTGVKKR